MIFVLYFAIVLFSVTQSASTKLFNRHSANSTVFNVIKASAALVFFALMAVGGFSFHLPTVLLGVLYGAALSLSMYAGYKALCLGPMALTSMLVSFSLLIPILWGLLAWDETLAPLRIVALAFLLTAILLTNADNLIGKRVTPRVDAQKGKYALWLFFVGTTFLCNGVCSVLQKQHQHLYPGAYSREFMLFAMLFCTVLFSVLALARLSPSEFKETKGKWLGVLSGVCNGLVGFLTLQLAGLENASILFPVISAGTLFGALLCGRFLFRERLKYNQYFALAFGMLAVVLLKL